MITISLPYGKQSIEVDLEKKNMIADPLKPKYLPPLPHIKKNVEDALCLIDYIFQQFIR